MTEPIKMYRFADSLFEDGLHVGLEVYYVVAETAQGYWVSPDILDARRNLPLSLRERRARGQRWVPKTSVRKYCYPDLTKALTSYLARKASQEGKARLQMETAQQARANETKLKELVAAGPSAFDGGVNLGDLPSYGGLHFL